MAMNKVTCSKVVYVLLAACVFILLHAPLFEWWSGTGIGQLTGAIHPSCFNDTMALLLIVMGCGAAVELPTLLSDTGNKWARVGAGWFLFILIVETIAFDGRFVHFKTLPWLRYSDLLIPILATLWIKSWFESRRVNEQKGHREEQRANLYYDDPDEVDFLGRSELVMHLSKHLKENKGNKNGATGIAISGGWGTGKSWVLEHIRKTLEGDGEICIDFKPWLYEDVGITRIFYQTLERQLLLHGLKIEELKRAVTEIDNDELVGFGRAVLSLLGVVTKGGGREQTIANIKKRLQEYDRQVYILIEDCDRLSREELLQVFSLVRNTGDFPNLTYIFAFDETVIKELIDKENGVGYVGKMINLQIELPPINDDVIGEYLLKAVKEVIGCEDEIDNPFNQIPITHYLPTVREAKRYLNLLSSDYKRAKEKLEHQKISMSDYCLLELLKYKMPELYYQLKATPNKYLTIVKTGWNGVHWEPIKNSFTDNPDGLKLMTAMFKEVKTSGEHYGLTGIANTDYYPLYFEGESGLRYVDKHEFIDTLEKGLMSQRIGKWVQEGSTGVISLMCIAYGYQTRKDVFATMAEYIWHRCERVNLEDHANDFAAGYGKTNYRHSYRQIKEMIKEIPQIHLLTYQNIDPDETTEEDDIEQLISESGLTLEHIGVWLNELRQTTNLDYPYSYVKHYMDMLWKKLMAGIGDRDIDTLNVIEIIGDSTFEDTFETMVLPLVCENPQRWLGATVAKLKYGDRDYYILKSEAIHALFGNLSRMDDEMKTIVNQAKDSDKEYVKEYSDLLYRTADLTVWKTKSEIDDKYKTPDCLEEKELPALGKSKIIGGTHMMPIENVIEQISKSAFWKGEELRIHREQPNYYFETKI